MRMSGGGGLRGRQATRLAGFKTDMRSWSQNSGLVGTRLPFPMPRTRIPPKSRKVKVRTGNDSKSKEMGISFRFPSSLDSLVSTLRARCLLESQFSLKHSRISSFAERIPTRPSSHADLSTIWDTSRTAECYRPEYDFEVCGCLCQVQVQKHRRWQQRAMASTTGTLSPLSPDLIEMYEKIFSSDFLADLGPDFDVEIASTKGKCSTLGFATFPRSEPHQQC